MNRFLALARDPRGPNGARLLFGLGTMTVWLTIAAVIGAVASDGGDLEGNETVVGVVPSDQDTAATVDPVTGETVPPEAPVAVDPTTGAPVPSGTPTGTGSGRRTTGSGTAGGATPATGATPDGQSTATSAPSVAGRAPGDRTGVTDTEIKICVHAPVTVSGAPLNLAEDGLVGIQTYVDFINQNGGIHGRKIKLTIADDRADSTGAKTAADTCINDGKNFVVTGTLGIDQIAIVAAEAARRGVPYMAGGGSEEVPIPGMYQIGASYTTHVQKLADFIATQPKLRGKRIGILVSDSQYIKPVAATFERALKDRGQTVSATVVSQKTQQNPDYNSYILQFRQTNTEVVAILTDPLTTSQIVQRCAAGAACGWTYTFSNFAHDTDGALALMAPTWTNQRVLGLSAACYYLAPEVDGPNCGAMKTARDQYIAVHGRDDWVENGSGAAGGYQIVGFLKAALLAAGPDPTRESFRAALENMNGLADLITGPITHQGSTNTMHGADKMVVLEAQDNVKFKMISPGFVDRF